MAAFLLTLAFFGLIVCVEECIQPTPQRNDD